MENLTTTAKITKTKYYDGTKLLSMLDLDGNRPEIYLVTTNRTGGKTTYFGRYVMNRFLKHGEQFMLLLRFAYELSDIASMFFNDISKLFFNGLQMRTKTMGKGSYCELWVGREPEEKEDFFSYAKCCGYAVALNKADQIKRFSHIFTGVQRMLFDEFQSETNHYCGDEVDKFQSIHTTVARGQGEQSRYVPVFMLSNHVTMLNPYYVAMGISKRLRSNTRYLKGHGFILENGIVESASDAFKASGFNKAFNGSAYNTYAAEGVYLSDNMAFIEKPESPQTSYVCTIAAGGRMYSMREYADEGLVWVSDTYDASFPRVLSVDLENHAKGRVMASMYSIMIGCLREKFQMGGFRFKDQKCKEVALELLGYS